MTHLLSLPSPSALASCITSQVFSGSDKTYVQSAVLAEIAAGTLLPQGTDPSRVGVLLCGHKDMATAVTAAFKEIGVDKILSNF